MIPTRAPSYIRTEAGTVYLCAWCPNCDATTRELRANGVQVSHGICAVHRDQQRKQITSNTNIQKET